MWGLLAKFWTAVRGGVAIGGLKKGIDKIGDFWGRWRRPYRAMPVIQPSTRDTKDPLTALGLVLMGAWIGGVHLGPLEEALKQTKALMDVLNHPMGWDGRKRGKSRKKSHIVETLERQEAEREGKIASLNVPELSPEEAQRRGIGNA